MAATEELRGVSTKDMLKATVNLSLPSVATALLSFKSVSLLPLFWLKISVQKLFCYSTTRMSRVYHSRRSV